MTPETTQILLRAADRVEFKGWCQGGYAKRGPLSPLPAYHDGGNCDESDPVADRWSAVGAIWLEKKLAGQGPHWDTEPEVDAVERLLRKIVDPEADAYRLRVGLRLDEYDIVDYNDTEGRTAPEVAHLLRAAALEDLLTC